MFSCIVSIVHIAGQDKINFNVRLTLLCSHPWIKCGNFLDLCYTSRTVLVYVDPTGLPPGVHSGVIKAFDVTCVEKGALFEIPITVVQPHIVQIENTKTFSPIESITFKPNTIQRDFILVPNNATWAVLKMISTDTDGYKTGKFFIHTMQLLPSKYCKAMETMKILPVNNQNETVLAFKCEQNNILEVCIAKFWSSFGDTKLKYSVEFRGITANGVSKYKQKGIMHAGNGIYKLDLTALGQEEISPIVVLKTATAILKPSESKITPLSGTRDVVPPGRQIYQNLLTYNLHISKAHEIGLCAPILCTMLYESEYESQFWMLFDSNKMMVASGDAYSGLTNTKLEKGDYVIKLQVRHEQKDILEKISETVMQISYKLQNSITLDVYENYNYSLIAGRKLSTCQLAHSVPKSIFIPPVTTERLNKASIPNHCTILNGTIIYAKDEIGRKTDINPFQYVLVDGVVKKNNGSPKTTKSVIDEYKEGLRDFNCSMIPKLDSAMAEDVYKQVLKEFPNYLPVHIAFINNFDSAEKKPLFPLAFSNWLKQIDREGQDLPKLTATLRRVIDTAAIVIEETPINSLLEFYGVKNDIRQDAHKMKATIDKQKITLLEAFVKKGIALCKLKIIEGEKDKEVETTSGQLEQIDEIYTNIGKFVDYADMKVIHFSIWHAHCHQHLGRMVKYLIKLYEEKLNKDILEEIRDLSAQAKWEHIVDAFNKIIVTSNPMGYRPF